MLHLAEPVRYVATSQLAGLERGEWVAQVVPQGRRLVWVPRRRAVYDRGLPRDVDVAKLLRFQVPLDVVRTPDDNFVVLDVIARKPLLERIDIFGRELHKSNVAFQPCCFVNSVLEASHALSAALAEGAAGIFLKRIADHYPVSGTAPLVWLGCIHLKRPLVPARIHGSDQ